MSLTDREKQRLDEDGFLWIVGRADQTIVRGGLKVQPDMVSRALERHPSVRAASVVGVDDDLVVDADQFDVAVT